MPFMALSRKPSPIPGWHVSDDPEPDQPASENGDDSRPSEPRHQVRLQKILAASGLGSRRSCEKMIEAGEVTINGHLMTKLPVLVDPAHDHIVVNGRRIKPPDPYVYIMLFKPRGVVCTNDDPEGRTRAIDLIKHPSHARLYPVGRLDQDSSGLLLLTNDGELANRLTHPRYSVHKVYEVTIAGALDEKGLKRLQRGLFLTGFRSVPKADRASRTLRSRLTIVKRDRDRTRLLMELREGRNRQIRRMMAQLGHQVKKLRRVQMGPIKLKGLKPGQWRELMPRELVALKKAAHRETRKKKTRKKAK